MILAGERRLRPILMTALATMCRHDSAGARLRRRIADAAAAGDRGDRRNRGVDGPVADRDAGGALLLAEEKLELRRLWSVIIISSDSKTIRPIYCISTTLSSLSG